MSRILAAAIGCLLSIAPAFAQDAIQARGVWCSSLDFARAFVEQWDGSNSEAVVDALNQASPDVVACRAAGLTIYEVEEFDRLETAVGTWLLVKVMVIAVENQGQWMQVSPFEAYTARKVEPLPGEDA